MITRRDVQSTTARANSLRDPMQRQRGVALIVALIFLLMLTILGVTVMQTASLEGRMAGNAQESSRIFQASQAAIDQALSDNTIFDNLVFADPLPVNHQTPAITFPAGSQYADVQVDVTAEWQARAQPGRSGNLVEINNQSNYDNIFFKVQATAKSNLSRSSATTTQGYVRPGPGIGNTNLGPSP